MDASTEITLDPVGDDDVLEADRDLFGRCPTCGTEHDPADECFRPGSGSVKPSRRRRAARGRDGRSEPRYGPALALTDEERAAGRRGIAEARRILEEKLGPK